MRKGAGTLTRDRTLSFPALGYKRWESPGREMEVEIFSINFNSRIIINLKINVKNVAKLKQNIIYKIVPSA
jgi:hypothetical protein